MAWPYTETTPIVQDILINGTWTNVTADTRGGNRSVTVRRGYSGEQASLSAGTCVTYLANPDGTYSNRNPLSPHYGMIGRNVRHRLGVSTGVTSLRLTDTTLAGTTEYDGARAYTVDKAVLDITGDLDIRIDVEPDDWRGRRGHILAAKWNSAGNQRSWILFTDAHGMLVLSWSTDGTSGSRPVIRSTTAVPTDTGRLALRVTLDVNNGAAGNTVTFCTSTTISGSWTVLGSAVVTSGTTSVFSSTSNLEVGTAADGGGRGLFAVGFNCDPFCGKVYAFELRNGIGGTLVAKMDATAQVAGTTSWVDALPTSNSWLTWGSAEITDADYRWHGEIPEMPSEWDSTGTDVVASVNASDIVERLTAPGQKPLRSPIFRNLTRYSLDGYWPMEDDAGADTLGAYTGATGAIRSAAFGTAPDLLGTAGALAFTGDDGFATAIANFSNASTGTVFFLYYHKFAVAPVTDSIPIVFYIAGGTAYRAVITVGTLTYKVEFFDSSSTSITSGNITFGSGAEPGQWIAMRLLLTQNGGNVDWALAWYPVGAPVVYGGSGSYAGTAGKPLSWLSPAFAGKDNLQLAHVALSKQDLEFEGGYFTLSTNGYNEETAYDRAFRLSAELGIPFWWVGPPALDSVDITQPMGVQGLKTGLDLLNECAQTDGGQLYAPRDKFGLAIRSYYATINRTGPELDYDAAHFSGTLTPREPRDIRNDVTVTRTGGGSARWVRDSGPLNTSDPTDDPQGAGLYDVIVPYSLGTDGQLLAQAQREILLGTWDDLRFAQVVIELHRSELLASASFWASLAALDLGRPFSMADLPLFSGGPDDVFQLVRGYTETFSNITRTIALNVVPYGPYITGVYGLAARPYAAKYTTLGSSVSSTATSMVFSSTNVNEHWSTTSEPYDVKIAGERITVTSMGAVTGSGPYTQTATVTRSVNGIVKAQTASKPITIFSPARWAFDGGVR
jgi:hypothetical protein